MNDLIEALNIFKKYLKEDNYAPTHCEHDVLMIVDVGKKDVSKDDKKRLDELGFNWDDQYDCWSSSRFGSA